MTPDLSLGADETDSALLSPKTRARRKAKKTPRTAKAGGVGGSADAGGEPVKGEDLIARIEAELPPAPPKPTPLPADPSVEQYKQFMREKYVYEQWENINILHQRRLAKAKEMGKHGWNGCGFFVTVFCCV